MENKIAELKRLNLALTEHAKACYSMLDQSIVENQRVGIERKINQLEKELDKQCPNWRQLY